MGNSKVKIVLDADVLIHFQKAGRLSFLPTILSEYEHIILSTVYKETRTIQHQIDQQVLLLKNITLVEFSPVGEEAKDYASLSIRFGRGESACMAYCKHHKDVLGSSNLRDIERYCQDNGITYLTTIDFLYYAYSRGKMSKEECDVFIAEVRGKDSKLPSVDISRYSCRVAL